MPFAYSNNGLSWRAVGAGWDLVSGEVLFDAFPSPAQLGAAFPAYAQAISTASLSQQAIAALSAGIQIVSTSTAALNGAYAVDAISQADIVAIETSLNAGKGFPGGATTFNYPDTSGVMHSFSEGNFTNFAAAVRDYVYALKSVIAGASTTLPSPAATIA